ncbi:MULTISPECIES: hypothetical protein [unclassified Caballeronia]|uniref:hypothetical protein n=1 Tax=unclassified Caballeronia TaxID=2646786 RepID=UPI002858E301|nr:MULTISPECIES: hypothetical protein [unclassified Caballeronia]MDR5773437.1 hypothetical protein [Caballeronia sp. LZ002]MDR5848871.1 hypothetical protein [Caballeronia sp. LZ003]
MAALFWVSRPAFSCWRDESYREETMHYERPASVDRRVVFVLYILHKMRIPGQFISHLGERT